MRDFPRLVPRSLLCLSFRSSLSSTPLFLAQRRKSDGLCELGHEYQAEAKGVAVAGRVAVAIRRATARLTEVPATATTHSVRTTVRTRRIGQRTATVVAKPI